jgi:hypothetical protein
MISARCIIELGIKSGLIRPAAPAVKTRAKYRPQRRWGLAIKRSEYPAGAEGQRAYNRAYQVARRNAERALKPKRQKRVALRRQDFPYTAAGARAYRKAYNHQYNRLIGKAVVS